MMAAQWAHKRVVLTAYLMAVQKELPTAALLASKKVVQTAVSMEPKLVDLKAAGLSIEESCVAGFDERSVDIAFTDAVSLKSRVKSLGVSALELKTAGRKASKTAADPPSRNGDGMPPTSSKLSPFNES